MNAFEVSGIIKNILESDVVSILKNTGTTKGGGFYVKFYVLLWIMVHLKDLNSETIEKSIGIRSPAVKETIEILKNEGLLTMEGLSEFMVKLTRDVSVDIKMNNEEEVKYLREIFRERYPLGIQKGVEWKRRKIEEGKLKLGENEDFKIVLGTLPYVTGDKNAYDIFFKNTKSESNATKRNEVSSDPDFGGSSFSDDDIPF